jgi:hypothetical protein
VLLEVLASRPKIYLRLLDEPQQLRRGTSPGVSNSFKFIKTNPTTIRLFHLALAYYFPCVERTAKKYNGESIEGEE